MAGDSLGSIRFLLILIPGFAVSTTLPSDDLLFWSTVDGNDGQIRWLPANPRPYKDNTSITVAGRYAGDNRWNAISVDHYEENAVMSDSISNSIYNAREWFESEGDAIQTVFGTSGYLVNAIAVDWYSRNFYWIDEGFNWIRLSSYDSVKTTLIIGTGLEKPQGIAVNPSKGYLYWTDSSRRLIERSSLTGKSRMTLIENLQNPTDITVDLTDEGRIYWIDEALQYEQDHFIKSSDYNGRDIRTEYRLLFVDGTLQDIAVNQEFLFIVVKSPSQGSIIKYLIKNSEEVFHELSLDEEVLDIAISGYDAQPFSFNDCFSNNQCSDFCVYNIDEGHECLCSEKFILAADGVNCTFNSTFIQPPYLMFTQESEISFMPVTLVHQGQPVSEGIDRIHTLLSDLELPLALAIDFHDKRLFFSDPDSIKVVPIANGEVPEILFQQIGRVEGLAVDWLSKNIYWTDYEFNHVVVCSYDGQFIKELFTDQVIRPRSIVIDPFEKLLFWSELGPPGQIESSNLDGSNRRVLGVLVDTDQASGLALDLHKQRLYFANRMDGSINYMHYDGSNLNTIYIHSDGYLNFFDITLYQDFIMWTESSGSRNGIYVIYNENEQSGVDGSLQIATSNVYDIETYDGSIQPPGSSLCSHESNGGCSRLCLTSSLNETTCACSDGFKVDANDYRQCVPAAAIMQDDFYLIADQEKHSVFQMNANEPYDYIGLDLGNIGNPESIAYDPIERRLYWADSKFKVIRRSSLDGTNVENVIKDEGIVLPRSVAVDYVGRLMFWTDSSLRKIEVAYLDGTVRYTLINTGNEVPEDIVVDPIGRRIFWTIQVGLNNPAIKTAYMDGGSERELAISENVNKPSGLVIHFKEGRLYWCDEISGIIESIKLDGTNPMLYVDYPDSTTQLSSLTLKFDDVIWVDNLKTSLRRLKSENGEATNVDDNHFGKMSSIHYHASISNLEEIDVEGNGCLEDNGGCSHICLPGRVAGQVTCKCNGNTPLLSDNKQCQTEILCPKTFLGGGVFDNCARSTNVSCEIYCIPEFTRSNTTTNVTCIYGEWNHDAHNLCIRNADPEWVITVTPGTTERTPVSSKGISGIIMMWITFCIVVSVIIVIFIILIIAIRSPEDVTYTKSADEKKMFDLAKRPLPDPNDDVYDDPDYDTIKNLSKENLKYYSSHIQQNVKQQEELQDPNYYLTMLDDGSHERHTDTVDGYHTRTTTAAAENSAFVDDYGTEVNIPGSKETPYYITVVDDKDSKSNAVANTTAVVDDYVTRTSITIDEDNTNCSIHVRAAGDNVSNSNDVANPTAVVDDYVTRTSITIDEDNTTCSGNVCGGA